MNNNIESIILDESPSNFEKDVEHVVALDEFLLYWKLKNYIDGRECKHIIQKYNVKFL